MQCSLELQEVLTRKSYPTWSAEKRVSDCGASDHLASAAFVSGGRDYHGRLGICNDYCNYFPEFGLDDMMNERKAFTLRFGFNPTLLKTMCKELASTVAVVCLPRAFPIMISLSFTSLLD